MPVEEIKKGVKGAIKVYTGFLPVMGLFSAVKTIEKIMEDDDEKEEE